MAEPVIDLGGFFMGGLMGGYHYDVRSAKP